MRTKKQLGYQTPPALVNQMISTKGQTPNTRLFDFAKKSEEMNDFFLISFNISDNVWSSINFLCFPPMTGNYQSGRRYISKIPDLATWARSKTQSAYV